MGKVAIIKSPGDQTIGYKEKAALRDLFIDLIKTRAVTRFTLSSVHWADIIVAKSSCHGFLWSYSR